MNDKQIFAALELSDQEVRLVTGEFFNTRFNIIKVERIPCSGLTCSEITNEEAVIAAINEAKENTKKRIGAEVKKVILAMPSYRFRKYSFKSTVDVEGIDKTVTIQDVRNAMAKAETMEIGKDLALIQTVCVRYTVNGISARKIPIGERCSQLTVDIDLLCADRKFSYDIVACVEKSGLEIMDIFLDVYAVGKEAALFEQAVDEQKIILKVERGATTLGLLRQGHLTAAKVFNAGIGSLAAPLVDTYGIKREMSVELLKYSARLNQEVCSTNPVHIWAAKNENGENETRTINEQQLVACVQKNIEIWLDYLQKTCVPILQAGETAVIITGEGGETDGLDELLAKRLGVEVHTYTPETLGGRNAGLTAALGLFYAYKDRLAITGYTDCSLDMEAFEKSVAYRDRKADSTNKEDTLTNKIKGLFEGKK
ncbi:MAG: cell division protein FtsA [Solobacterium sp.]|nr:cell division protein FtsA [Solobacterium sp.]